MFSKLISSDGGAVDANTSVSASLVQKNSPILATTVSKLVLLGLCIVILSGCPAKKEIVEAPPEAPTKVVPVKPKSAAPIVKAPKETVMLAQAALTKLGYEIGGVDGLWGPRSAKAIRDFEAQQKIWSANGHISELNLDFLRRLSGIDSVEPKPKNKPRRRQKVKTDTASATITTADDKITEELGITAKLNQQGTLEQGPQLIIVDREYDVFLKPNPYSATLTKLAAGTGIYIVARESDWYEIESLDRQKGYVKVD